MKIGGNTWALLQVRRESTKNSIGERVGQWADCASICGWLDLSSGDSKHTTFDAKIQESTHIFLSDFENLKNLSTEWTWSPFNLQSGVISKNDGCIKVDVSSENARMVVNGKAYEILLIDDPMGMGDHLEFYLKFIGGAKWQLILLIIRLNSKLL